MLENDDDSLNKRENNLLLTNADGWFSGRCSILGLKELPKFVQRERRRKKNEIWV